MSKKRKARRPRPGDPPDWRAIVKRIGPCPAYDGVFTVEGAADVAKARVEWQKRLKAELERHRAQARMSDSDVLREINAPTVPIAVEDPEGSKKARRNMTRVRQAEAWRHNRLTGMQRDAEREMEFAWRHRTSGLGAAISRYGEPGGGASTAVDWQSLGATLESAWAKWAKATRSRRIRRNAAIDCLAEPKTLAEIERAHGLPRGHGFDNYVAALDLWCELRGWIPRKAVA